MIPIRVDTDIRLTEGFNEFEIDTDRNISITFEGDSNSDVFVRIKKAKKVKLNTFTKSNAHITYLFWNETEADIEFDETHEVMQDAMLHLAYGESNQAGTNRSTYVNLREQGAFGKVSSASLVRSNKHFDIQVASFAPNTNGEMENYSVVLNGGKYYMNAIGKIIKGAYGSQSHQTSRSLTFDEKQSSEIIPTLLIDDNDVQASHAMTVGRVDEEQLYYMTSRGLSMSQCTQLISSGYLLPIIDTIKNEELQKILKVEMEDKIEKLCMM